MYIGCLEERLIKAAKGIVSLGLLLILLVILLRSQPLAWRICDSEILSSSGVWFKIEEIYYRRFINLLLVIAEVKLILFWGRRFIEHTLLIYSQAISPTRLRMTLSLNNIVCKRIFHFFLGLCSFKVIKLLCLITIKIVHHIFAL